MKLLLVLVELASLPSPFFFHDQPTTYIRAQYHTAGTVVVSESASANITRL